MTRPGRTHASALEADAFELHRARSEEDWRAITALRYRALRRRGDVPESAIEAFADRHDHAFASQVFLLTREGHPVGTTRSSLGSTRRRWALPAMECFAREIEAAVGGAAPTILDASLTMVDPAFAEPRAALIHLFKAHTLRCATEGADWLVTEVPESQIGFYRRMFNMRILSGAETFANLASPRVLMGLAYRDNAAVLCRRMPVLAASAEEETAFAANGAIAFTARPSPRPSP